MAVIYEPKGKAKEYSPLALNIYKGCIHGCDYCFAPGATHKNRAEFHAGPDPKANILEQIRKEAKNLAGDSRNILLSFISDPYQPTEADLCLTRQAIEILNEYGLKTTILTKGGLLAVRDFDLLSRNPGNEFAVTLTTDDYTVSKRWEPRAAPPVDRIEALRIAKQEYGIRTWVSFEPVIDPEAVLRLIEITHDLVDLYRVGKLNHHQYSKSINWPAFRRRVVECLERFGTPYYLKKDLLAA